MPTSKSKPGSRVASKRSAQRNAKPVSKATKVKSRRPVVPASKPVVQISAKMARAIDNIFQWQEESLFIEDVDTLIDYALCSDRFVSERDEMERMSLAHTGQLLRRLVASLYSIPANDRQAIVRDPFKDLFDRAMQDK